LIEELKDTGVGEVLLSYLPIVRVGKIVLKALITATWEELKSFAYSEGKKYRYIPNPL
jgi:hypothetical protein